MSGVRVNEGIGPEVDTELVDVGGEERHRQRVIAIDDFSGGEALTDQSGGGVRVFDFASAVNMVWVLMRSTLDPADNTVVGRANPFGGIPGPATGVPCLEGIPTPLTVIATRVRVYAPANTAISVWGYRR